MPNDQNLTDEQALDNVMKSGESSENKLNAVANIINGSANVFNSLGLGSLISGAGNRNNGNSGSNASDANMPTRDDEPKKNNTMLYVALGVVGLLVALFFFKRKKTA